jgi:hypothetical protein
MSQSRAQAPPMKKAYMMFKELVAFGKGVISEGGSGSFGRVGATAIVVCSLIWVSYIVFKNGALPDLSGVSLFLSSGVSATYGASKVAGVITAKNNPPTTEGKAQ